MKCTKQQPLQFNDVIFTSFNASTVLWHHFLNNYSGTKWCIIPSTHRFNLHIVMCWSYVTVSLMDYSQMWQGDMVIWLKRELNWNANCCEWWLPLKSWLWKVQGKDKAQSTRLTVQLSNRNKPHHWRWQYRTWYPHI